MARVLITGAAGFLGTHLARCFIDAGHQVRAGDIQGADLSTLEAWGAEPAVCDITSEQSTREALDGIELVVHAAGIFDLTAPKELLWSVNAEGAERVSDLAAEAGASRFVMISSTGVYGEPESFTAEEGPKRPSHPYAASKWAGEQRVVASCAKNELPLSVLRPTLIYGPGSRYGLAPWVAIFALRRLKDAGSLPIAHGGPRGHFVHVEDVARAALHLAEEPAAVGGIFNVADEAPLESGSMVRILAESVGAKVSGSPLPWVAMRLFRMAKPVIARLFEAQNAKLGHIWDKIVTEEGLQPALRPRIDADWIDYLSADYTYDTGRLRATGFELKHPDIRKSLPETVKWYREQRWIPA